MFFKNNSKNKPNISYIILIFTALISIIGALIYRFYALNLLGILITAVLASITLIWLKKLGALDIPVNYSENNDFNDELGDKQTETTSYKRPWLYLILYLLAAAMTITFLLKARTDHYLISPWEVVSSWFFVVYGAASIILAIKIRQGLYTKIQIYLLSFHYLLSASVAIIVYRLGYGFDPIIHQASVNYINAHGFIPPKTLYYIGQYALEIFGHKIFQIPIAWLDYLLVPLLAAIFIPESLKQFLLSFRPARLKNSYLLILFLPILSFPPFIITTPQSLAYLFLILTILWTIIISQKTEAQISIWLGPILLSLATFCIHPLAGIPAILFWSLSFVKNQDNFKTGIKLVAEYKKLLLPIILLLSAIGLPMAFYFNNKLGFVWQWPWPKNLINLSLPNQENFVLNFLYLYDRNWSLIIIILIILALWLAVKNKRHELWSSGMMFGTLLLSYIASKQLDFSFLINYEQSDYPNRILTLIIIFSLPALIYLLKILIDKISQQEKISRIIWLIFGVISLSAALYLSYPRRDNYFNSRGFSTSKFDEEAVALIELQSSKPYIVLANQAVSAAALRQFGFERYLSNGLYFYPLPTSSPLYEYYLKMVYEKPMRETMLRAMELTNVNEAYLVINKYWWEANKIIAEAQLGANESFNIEKGEIYIFKYTK